MSSKNGVLSYRTLNPGEKTGLWVQEEHLLRSLCPWLSGLSGSFLLYLAFFSNDCLRSSVTMEFQKMTMREKKNISQSHYSILAFSLESLLKR